MSSQAYEILTHALLSFQLFNPLHPLGSRSPALTNFSLAYPSIALCPFLRCHFPCEKNTVMLVAATSLHVTSSLAKSAEGRVAHVLRLLPAITNTALATRVRWLLRLKHMPICPAVKVEGTPYVSLRESGEALHSGLWDRDDRTSSCLDGQTRLCRRRLSYQCSD